MTNSPPRHDPNPSPTPRLHSPFTRALLAGALAGTTVDLSLHPLDTLKTRLQSPHGFSRSGGFRGIYSGVGSALIGSAPGAALFFVSYEGVKSWLHNLRSPRNSKDWERGKGKKKEDDDWTDPFSHMAAASVGEVAACAVRVPTEVVKQRAQAMQGTSSLLVLRQILDRRKIVGVGLVGVWRELYTGWSVTVMREVPFTVIQFPIWEALKESRRRGTGRERIPAWESGLFGSLAGAIAAGATTPLDALKTRMMLSRERESAWVMGREILRTSGARAFFSGLGPRVLWISGGGAIFLGSYEWAYNELGGGMED